MAQDKVVEQIEKYQKLNEKTAAEREALLAQLAELNEAKAEYQTHISTLETQAKEVNIRRK
jgi:cell division septum initiation protein DivIVA